MTLFGKIVLIDDQVKMSSLGWAKIHRAITAPVKSRSLDSETKGACHLKLEIMLPLSTESKRLSLSANHWKLGKRHGTDFCSQPSEEIKPEDTLILDFQSPGYEMGNSCLFCHPVLFYGSLGRLTQI